MKEAPKIVFKSDPEYADLNDLADKIAKVKNPQRWFDGAGEEVDEGVETDLVNEMNRVIRGKNEVWIDEINR
jgi:hypothetical protein